MKPKGRETTAAAGAAVRHWSATVGSINVRRWRVWYMQVQRTATTGERTVTYAIGGMRQRVEDARVRMLCVQALRMWHNQEINRSA